MEIPAQGWWDIVRRTYEQVVADRLLAVAAGVVFFGLLAIFPAISAIISVYGLFFDVATVRDHLALLAEVVPEEALTVIQGQIDRIVSAGPTRLGLAFAVSLAVAVWSANSGLKALIDALNVAYDEVERRRFICLTLLSLALTVGAVAAVSAAMGLVVIFPIILSFAGLDEQAQRLLLLLRWPALLAGLLLGLAVLYRFGPDRQKPRWRWVSLGSVVAAVGWLAGSAALSFYLANFADYNATYGSLAAAIGLMMWMWLSAIVILLGAEINAEIERQTAVDTTVGAEQPLGQRGAAVADSVGPAWR